MNDEVQDSQEQVGTQVNERLAKARAIADSSYEFRQQEEGLPADDYVEEQEPEVSEQSLDKEEEPVQTKHKLKVNGKEIELTFDEILARAQKVEAADQYLAEAARIAKGQPSKDVEPEVEDRSEEEELAIVRAIQMGDEKEALQAIRKLRNNPSKQDDVAKLVDDRIAGREAAEKFKSDYKDIVEDPYLFQIASAKDAELVKNGDNRALYERWAAIGDELRGWKSKLAGETKMEQKQAKKADIVSINRAGSKSFAPSEEDAEENVSDIIRSMAKRRGQI